MSQADIHQPADVSVVFMGTAEFAVPSLRALADAGFSIRAVYTQPPRPAGRGQKERRTPVHDAALALGLEVVHPATLKTTEVQEALVALHPMIGVVAAYGLILPPAVLAIPRHGFINVHGSALPRWRGAAPIQRAILAGDTATGVDLFQMEAGLDTGPVFTGVRVPITPTTTAQTLQDRLAEAGAALLPDLLMAIARGEAVATAQPEAGVTYAHKITKDEGHIDWSEPADAIERRLRALGPWPGCYTDTPIGRLNLIAGDVVDGDGPPGSVLDDQLTVACGTGALRLKIVQRAGRKPMTADALLRGTAIPLGTRFE
ncbi:MAG: methionyl-tRNA formyltransferase [Geminicoccaceae bacterium]